MNRRKFVKALSGVAALAVPAGLAVNGLRKRNADDQIHATDEYYKVSGITQWHSEAPEHITLEQQRAALRRIDKGSVPVPASDGAYYNFLHPDAARRLRQDLDAISRQMSVQTRNWLRRVGVSS